MKTILGSGPFVLPRLRAQNDLLELRAADLRFSVADAEQFLNRVLRLGLAPRRSLPWRREISSRRPS